MATTEQSRTISTNGIGNGNGFTQGITVAIETITPAKAQEMLDNNTNNRPIRKDSVERWAGAMLRGEWKINGEGIAIDTNGNLANGQHRLMGIIKSGVAVQMIVTRNVEPSAQTTMDQGVKRTMNDTLRWMGEKNTATLGSSLRLLHYFRSSGTISNSQSRNYGTKDQVLEFFKEHPDLRNFQNTPQSSSVRHLLTPSLAATLYYLFSRIDEQDAKDFFEKLGSGADLHNTHPIYALRRVLEHSKSKAHTSMSIKHRGALAIKAWNQYRAGNNIHMLRWSGGGKMPEAFPRINEFDYDSF